MKYLKNNAQPRTLTIYQQRRTEYFGEASKGKFIKYRIDIAMHREIKPLDERDRDGIDQIAIESNLPKNEKIVISYKNGKYSSEQRKNINYSFTVIHYPHIIGFKEGVGMRDEREYNFLVGNITEVENDNDAEIAMKTFGFLDEVDEKGKIILENPNKPKKDDKFIVDLKNYPKRFEDVETFPAIKKQMAPTPVFKSGSEILTTHAEERNE